MSLPVEIIILAVALGFFGAVVQGVIGFGMGVVASPILALARPELVPVAIILAAVAMPVMALLDEWRQLDWRSLGWIMLGRVPSTAIGVWIVAALPVPVLQVVIATIVLLMVLLNLVRISIPQNPATMTTAGFVAGVSGTAAGIGGPPLALVLAGEDPPKVRATLAASFLFGTAISLAGLALGGATTTNALVVGLAMVPATVAGMLVARPLRGRLSPHGFRIGVLVLSSASAILLAAQAIS